MSVGIRFEPDPKKRRAIQEAITAGLPDWFGRPDSNLHYAEQAELLTGWVGRVQDRDVGLLLLKRHGSSSAEIYWIGVERDCHRCGVGRALVEHVCHILTGEGRRLLLAYSLHPDDPDENYRRTRRFYESIGFFLAASDHHGDPNDMMAWYAKVLPAPQP